MKNPQTRAEMIGKYGCLAMCYLYCVGVAPESEGEMIKHVSTAMDKGLLDEECTVLNASKLLEHFTGKKRLRSVTHTTARGTGLSSRTARLSSTQSQIPSASNTESLTPQGLFLSDKKGLYLYEDFRFGIKKSSAGYGEERHEGRSG